MGTGRTPFPYGRPNEQFNLERFRSDQEASVRYKNYSEQELVSLLNSSLVDNQLNLFRYGGVVAEEEYSSIAVRYEVLRAVHDAYTSERHIPDGAPEASQRKSSYDELVAALIESREIQVIMNRAQGNYYVPDDSPPPEPHPPPPRGSDARGGIWGAAAILGVLGLVSSQWPLLVAALVVSVYALGHRAGSDS